MYCNEETKVKWENATIDHTGPLRHLQWGLTISCFQKLKKKKRTVTWMEGGHDEEDNNDGQEEEENEL